MFLISLNGKETIFEQIKNQIIKFINAGVLKADDKLPSVRELASSLGINPNTVQKAYSELEKEGYIYSLNKKGNFVCDLKKENKKNDDIYFFLNKLKEEGYSKKEIANILKEVYKED